MLLRLSLITSVPPTQVQVCGFLICALHRRFIRHLLFHCPTYLFHACLSLPKCLSCGPESEGTREKGHCRGHVWGHIRRGCWCLSDYLFPRIWRDKVHYRWYHASSLFLHPAVGERSKDGQRVAVVVYCGVDIPNLAYHYQTWKLYKQWPSSLASGSSRGTQFLVIGAASDQRLIMLTPRMRSFKHRGARGFLSAWTVFAGYVIEDVLGCSQQRPPPPIPPKSSRDKGHLVQARTQNRAREQIWECSDCSDALSWDQVQSLILHLIFLLHFGVVHKRFI